MELFTIEDGVLIINRKCISCKESFVSNQHHIHYCSDECKEKLKYTCECRMCEVEFRYNHDRVYCSDNCKRTRCIRCEEVFVFRSSPNEKYCSAECKKIHLTKKCRYCDDDFVSITGSDFCSNDCKRGYAKIGKKAALCKNCKKIITFAKDYWSPIYCDDECRIEHVAGIHKQKLKKKKPKESDVEDIVSFRVESLLSRKRDFIVNMRTGLNYSLIDSFNDTHRERILERDEYSCFICEQDHGLEVHHILPRGLGGDNSDDNLVALCIKCHRAVETGDVNHAVRKCVERAKRNFGIIKEKHEIKMNQNEFANLLGYELSKIFDHLKNDEPQEEAMAFVDDLMDTVEAWKLTR